MKPRWRKGTALLQTLVMSILLSMIAVSLMKWVLARYMIAARNYRSAVTVARAGGYSQVAFTTWNFGAIPVNTNFVITEPNGTQYRVCIKDKGGTKMEVTSDADVPMAACP